MTALPGNTMRRKCYKHGEKLSLNGWHLSTTTSKSNCYFNLVTLCSVSGCILSAKIIQRRCCSRRNRGGSWEGIFRSSRKYTNENLKLGKWKLGNGSPFNAAGSYVVQYFCEVLELALLGQFQEYESLSKSVNCILQWWNRSDTATDPVQVSYLLNVKEVQRPYV